ncbi:hypothetical protein BJ138DRAFT_1158118 [Hygrophoropsis aurantiaca]|uniref:Uncharacterized protein n=1 Tax=Hygrophoropsis aurantiaca TaxID=72124 RepID=A0ACB8A588_9AGAM|nr:hypothetical protein BJ138DRAFT_1158118 [Hygrophoropsis aurantiaca]
MQLNRPQSSSPFPYASYNNILGIHRPLRASEISRDSSLSTALGGQLVEDKPADQLLYHELPTVFPIAITEPFAGLPENFVPMPRFTDRAHKAIIVFEREGTNNMSVMNGVSMVQCLGGQGIKDPDRVLSADMPNDMDSITFVLTWPGYAPQYRQIPINMPNRGVLTRRELAMVIAGEFRDFVSTCNEQHLIPNDPNWQIGRDGWSFQHMRLSSIWSPDKRYWYPSVRVVNKAVAGFNSA